MLKSFPFKKRCTKIRYLVAHNKHWNGIVHTNGTTFFTEMYQFLYLYYGRLKYLLSTLSWLEISAWAPFS